MLDSVIIRSANKDDMDSVLELIRELASFENAAEQVTNTVDQLKRDGFGETKIFDCQIAEFENAVVGFALFYTSYSTWKGPCLYLEHFLVTSNMRNKGIGKRLFEEVFNIAKERKVKRFEWQVLEWNEDAINFYKKYDADMDMEWVNGKIFI